MMYAVQIGNDSQREEGEQEEDINYEFHSCVIFLFYF